MKTLIIYDQCGEEPIKFYEVDGDVSHLDGCYVNDDELLAIVEANDPLKSFPQGFVGKVIVCGFPP